MDGQYHGKNSIIRLKYKSVLFQKICLQYEIVLSCLDADKSPDQNEQTKSTKQVKEIKQKDQSPNHGNFVRYLKSYKYVHIHILEVSLKL